MNIKQLIAIVVLSVTASTSFANSLATETVKWTTKENAGVFFDPDPQNAYIAYQAQACVKEPLKMMINGQYQRVIKVRCRQPNGLFKYIW